MYWLLGVMSVICLAWFARADFVKLQDGTVLNGTIIDEDAISVTIQAENVNGSVIKKRWFLKSDTAEIHRTTPEEKAARDMELAFAALQKLQIDPTNSFLLGYYDQTLTNVFRKFLADYPDSSYAKEVTDKIAEWEAEQALVASGKVKVKGRWLTAEEVAARRAREAVEQAHQEGLAFLSHKQFGDAVEQFEFVISKSANTSLVQQSQQLRTDAYQQWLNFLERQRQRLRDEIKNMEQRVTNASNAKAAANAKLNPPSAGGGGHSPAWNMRTRAQSLGQPRDVSGGGETTQLGGTGTDRTQYFTAAAQAQLELDAAENRLAEARRQAAATEETLARIQPQAAALGIAVAPSGEGGIETQVVAKAAPTVATQASSSEEPSGILKGIGQFATNYWWIVLAGAIVLIWLVSRALGR
jgi:hypothetical protein